MRSILLSVLLVLASAMGCKAPQASAPPTANARSGGQGPVSVHGTGAVLDRPSNAKLSQMHTAANTALLHIKLFTENVQPQAIPAQYSWRNSITPVEDQKDCGFCYAFAAVAALEANWNIAHHAITDQSEQHVINCIDGDCGRGGKLTDAMQYLVSSGTSDALVEGYHDAKEPCNQTVNTPYQGDATDFVDSRGGVPDAQTLKRSIMEHGPIAAFIYAAGQFRAFNKQPANAVISEDSTLDGHFILITGWDDNIAYGNANHGAWQIKNSWGTDWGNDGFAWIAYGIRDIGDNAMWIHAR